MEAATIRVSWPRSRPGWGCITQEALRPPPFRSPRWSGFSVWPWRLRKHPHPTLRKNWSRKVFCFILLGAVSQRCRFQLLEPTLEGRAQSQPAINKVQSKQHSPEGPAPPSHFLILWLLHIIPYALKGNFGRGSYVAERDMYWVEELKIRT